MRTTIPLGLLLSTLITSGCRDTDAGTPTQAAAPLAAIVSPADNASGPLVVLVHGRDQSGRAEAEVRKEWLDALHDGLHNAGLERLAPRISQQFVWYADLYKLDSLYVPSPACSANPATEDAQRSAYAGLIEKPPPDWRTAGLDIDLEFKRRALLRTIELGGVGGAIASSAFVEDTHHYDPPPELTTGLRALVKAHWAGAYLRHPRSAALIASYWS